VFFTQFGDVGDGVIQMKMDAAFFEQLMAAEHDVFFELEIGDAVDEQAADAVVAVVDMHFVAFAAEDVGGSQACRACADDADGDSSFGDAADGFDPAIGEGGFGDVFFDGADGDGFEAFFDDAIAFAEAVLRADAAADFGEGIGGAGHGVGFFEAAFGGEFQPVGDVVLQRAVNLAEGDAALRAAGGLNRGFGGVEIAVDFVEIFFAGGRRFRFRVTLIGAREF